jgi:hypothetical protein
LGLIQDWEREYFVKHNLLDFFILVLTGVVISPVKIHWLRNQEYNLLHL